MEFHCPACSTRPRANLTVYDDLVHGPRFYRPECLYTIAIMKIAKPEPAAGTRGGVDGLRVIDAPRSNLVPFPVVDVPRQRSLRLRKR
jgi:hypothetical protein